MLLPVGVKTPSVFMSCEHPVVIDRNGRTMSVPCGQCRVCLDNKANAWRARLSQEIADNRFSLFFTLTYDNAHIPYFRLDSNGIRYVRNGSVPVVVDCLDGTYEVYRDKDSIPTSDVDYCPPIRGLGRDDCFGVVSRSDVQKFLKRFRYYLKSSLERYYRINYLYKYRCFLISLGYTPGHNFCSWLDSLDEETYQLYNCVSSYYYNEYEQNKKKTKQQVRYFICSEYGPTGYRPHYHGLFFFDSEEVAKYAQRCIYQAWTLCSTRCIDVQFVSGNADSYVSKYVTGNTDLPEVLRLKSTRTFCLASKGPAIGYKSFGFEDLQKHFVDGTIFVSKTSYTQSGEQISVYPLPGSVVRRFFPKCFGYQSLSRGAKLRVYSRFVSCKRINGKVVLDVDGSLDKLSVYRDFFQLYNRYGVDIYGNSEIKVRAHFKSSDVLAAFACLRWCLHFGCTPDHYVMMLDWFHYQLAQYNLSQQLLLEDSIMSRIAGLPGSNYALLCMDASLLARLPFKYHDAVADKELDILFSSHNVSYHWFYDKCGNLDLDLVHSLSEQNTERFRSFLNDKLDSIALSNKSKRANEHVLDNDSII